jgi:hypothetical protein
MGREVHGRLVGGGAKREIAVIESSMKFKVGRPLPRLRVRELRRPGRLPERSADCF